MIYNEPNHRWIYQPAVTQLLYGILLALLLSLIVGISPALAADQDERTGASEIQIAQTVVSRNQATVRIDEETRHAGEFVVPINKSQILRLDEVIADLLVGNPEIADVLAITNRSIYVLGKELGSTSLTIYGDNKRLIAVVDLVVAADVEGIKTRLHELMPNEEIEVRAAADGVVLSGRVSNSQAVNRAVAIARDYAGDESVTNLITVAGSQQVMLSVRFAEVSRQATQELGLNFSLIGDDFSLVSGNAFLSGNISPTAFATGTASFEIGENALDLLFDALEEKSLLKTLAEPNLIALSGDTASFLAGGEFPVPVAQEAEEGTATITVEFKQFGVALAFTPTVLEDGLINIVVEPEVSRIDRTNDIRVQGFSIPGIQTRRAKTTVELRDGQSFAIAGLLQSDFTDSMSQLPGIGNVPVLGALFRSSQFLKQETELVIVVTPHLVKPAPAGSLVTPADGFKPPTPIDLYLFGRLEAPDSGSAAPQAALGAQNAGGIVGSYGHIIR